MITERRAARSENVFDPARMHDRLSRHFVRGEFACKCGCGLADPDPGLIDVLERVRDAIDSPLIIVSGHRCERHNRNVGGAKRSYHVLGKAADVRAARAPLASVYNAAAAVLRGRGGLKMYKTFVHIDVRDGLWRG